MSACVRRGVVLEMAAANVPDQKSQASAAEKPNEKPKDQVDVKSGSAPFRIQIASDLHLEHLKDPDLMLKMIKPSAPYLALVRNPVL